MKLYYLTAVLVLAVILTATSAAPRREDARDDAEFTEHDSPLADSLRVARDTGDRRTRPPSKDKTTTKSPGDKQKGEKKEEVNMHRNKKVVNNKANKQSGNKQMNGMFGNNRGQPNNKQNARNKIQNAVRQNNGAPMKLPPNERRKMNPMMQPDGEVSAAVMPPDEIFRGEISDIEGGEAPMPVPMNEGMPPMKGTRPYNKRPVLRGETGVDGVSGMDMGRPTFAYGHEGPADGGMAMMPPLGKPPRFPMPGHMGIMKPGENGGINPMIGVDPVMQVDGMYDRPMTLDVAMPDGDEPAVSSVAVASVAVGPAVMTAV